MSGISALYLRREPARREGACRSTKKKQPRFTTKLLCTKYIIPISKLCATGEPKTGGRICVLLCRAPRLYRRTELRGRAKARNVRVEDAPLQPYLCKRCRWSLLHSLSNVLSSAQYTNIFFRSCSRDYCDSQCEHREQPN